jgi:hypothetical protein
MKKMMKMIEANDESEKDDNESGDEGWWRKW